MTRPNRATRQQVEAAHVPLFDNRTQEEHDGKRVRGQKRGGHIPGSHLIPQRALYELDGRYLSGKKLRKLLPKSLRGTRGTPIAYCVGGVRSALFALLMEARFGLVIANYDGSMWEWSAIKELPVDKPVSRSRTITDNPWRRDKD